MIYLDYAATTPVDNEVASEMMRYLTDEGHFGNAASNTHDFGLNADEAVEYARACIASVISAAPTELIFTSGATEANNLAIFGVASKIETHQPHMIASMTEHASVLDTFQALQKNGVEITLLQPDHSGLITAEQLQNAIRPNTILVSIMLVNNETGVLQDIAALSRITKQNDILFHCDAAQALGKIRLNVSELGVDLMTLSAHKVYGPKGIGALYVRQPLKKRLKAQMFGGGHEFGLRSGTLPTHQIVGFAKACEKAQTMLDAENQRIQFLFEKVLAFIKNQNGVFLNGHETQRVPHIINLTIEGVHGDALLAALHPFALSTGSACNSWQEAGSHVLRALGLSDDAAKRSIRVSFGRSTTSQDVDDFLNVFASELNRLRSLGQRFRA